jgi:hypothetical protein
MQAVCSLCHAYVIHASRRQTLERRLRWHARAFTVRIARSDLDCSPEWRSACSALYLQARMYPHSEVVPLWSFGVLSRRTAEYSRRTAEYSRCTAEYSLEAFAHAIVAGRLCCIT